MRIWGDKGSRRRGNGGKGGRGEWETRRVGGKEIGRRGDMAGVGGEYDGRGVREYHGREGNCSIFL